MTRQENITNIAFELQKELDHGERTALRFPIQLPVQVIAEGVDYTAESENFSSSGALLRVSAPLTVGSIIQFLLEIPPGTLGSDATAAIHGEGRVLRSFEEKGKHYAAIVITDYRFQ